MSRRILAVALVAGLSATSIYVLTAPRDASAAANDVAAPPTAEATTPADKSWIARSNEFANLLIDIEKKHSPESASADGLSQYDEKISVATHEDDLAEIAETRAALAKLQEQLPKEQNKYVRQDLEIMIHRTQLKLKAARFRRGPSGSLHQRERCRLPGAAGAAGRPGGRRAPASGDRAAAKVRWA